MDEDRSLVEALKNNDHSAFDTLFRKYVERLYTFALSLTKDKFIAEEIVQIVFLKIWEKRQKIDEHFSFKSFIFSIAYNETITWIRKNKSEQRKVLSFSHQLNIASNETEIKIEFRNLESISNKLIESMPEKRQQIFKLSREQGFSNREIAEKLNISIKTVENQMTSALRFLKENLSNNTIIGMLYYFIFLHQS
jgi:RNA polymerase sigma-70 factor, ECF subfamily